MFYPNRKTYSSFVVLNFAKERIAKDWKRIDESSLQQTLDRISNITSKKTNEDMLINFLKKNSKHFITVAPQVFIIQTNFCTRQLCFTKKIY